MDQGVQTSGGMVNNVRGQQRQPRGGGYRGGGDNRRFQHANSSRYSHDMRGRPPMRGNFNVLCSVQELLIHVIKCFHTF
jgi:hypothetical protein